MPWLSVLPGNHQTWYWLSICKTSLSSMREDFNCLCHFSMEEWSNVHIHIFIFLLNDQAILGLIPASAKLHVSQCSFSFLIFSLLCMCAFASCQSHIPPSGLLSSRGTETKFPCTIGHVALVAIVGANSLVPCHVVKTLCLIWRSGTRRWNLRVPNLQTSCSDLT